MIFIQQVSAESRREINLCFECARERGMYADGEKLMLSFPALLSEILPRQKQVATEEKTCPVCARTLSQISRDLAVGCPECYTYFSAEIKELQKKRGIVGPWTGALPSRLGRQKSVLPDRTLLQIKLEECLTREDYEKAAIYRDRLRLLENSVHTAHTYEQHS